MGSLNVTLVLRWLELGSGSVSRLQWAAHTPEVAILRSVLVKAWTWHRTREATASRCEQKLLQTYRS